MIESTLITAKTEI